MVLTALCLWASVAVAAPALPAANYKLEALKEAAPAEVAAPLREAVQGEGWRVVDPKGKPLVDLWLRKEAPRSPPPKEEVSGLKFPQLAEGTFLGVARYHQKHYDYKNKPIPPGVYTLRLGVQPSDGDHLGVSDTRDFALLCPAADDKAIAPIPTAESVKLSSKVSGTKHPSVVWIKTTAGEAKRLPALFFQEDREYQVLDFELPLTGEPPTREHGKPVRIGLVVVGTAPEI